MAFGLEIPRKLCFHMHRQPETGPTKTVTLVRSFMNLRPLGYLDEHTLTTALKRWFPEDEIQHKGKGGDVIHSIVRKGRQVGLIVYECKRVKHYSAGHVKQAAEAKEKRKADFAILVTNAMKKGTQGFYTERGVIVVHTAGLQSILNILRSQIIQIAEMKLGQQERDKAIRMTLEYLEGPEFSNSMDSIIQESIGADPSRMRTLENRYLLRGVSYAS